MIAPDEEEESEQEEQPEPATDPLSDVSCSLISTVSAYSKLLLNEPTVGMYFVQEHVHKSVPFVLATKARIKETQKEAQLCRRAAAAHARARRRLSRAAAGWTWTRAWRR